MKMSSHPVAIPWSVVRWTRSRAFQQIVVRQAPFALLNLVNHGNEHADGRTINPELGANIGDRGDLHVHLGAALIPTRIKADSPRGIPV